MRLDEIARALDCELRGAPDTEIVRVWPIETAVEGDLSFVANPRYRRFLSTTEASALIVAPDIDELEIPTLRTAEPYLAFARALRLFYVPPPRVEGIHPAAVIAADAQIGPRASIGPHVVIEGAVRIGADATLGAGVSIGHGVVVGDRFTAYPRVAVREGVRIGNDVILHAGSVIGSDGFGYVPSAAGKLEKIVQGGTVILGDEVEVGANATIDRATVGATVIGRGVKIDNLVQIGHGCEIGDYSVLVAQCGLAGSTRVGAWVQMGGQTGTAGHLTIGDLSRLAARTGVTSDIAAGAVVGGYPAVPIETWRRSRVLLNKLGDVLRRLRRLEKAIGAGEDGDPSP